MFTKFKSGFFNVQTVKFIEYSSLIVIAAYPLINGNGDLIKRAQQRSLLTLQEMQHTFAFRDIRRLHC